MRRWWRLGLVAIGLVALAPPVTSAAAPPVPATFGVRVEGQTVIQSVSAAAANANPGSGYTFAKVDSAPSIAGDDGRLLQMKATGAAGNPGDLAGVVLFEPSTPTRGTSDFPLYSEAFFPAEPSLGQSETAEKCAANPSSTESEACRSQPGPYALAEVKPEEELSARGYARSGGAEGDGGRGGDTESTSEVVPRDDGSILGHQLNVGRNAQVPGTPIMVDSFRTESEVVASLAGVDGKAVCTADVSVNGQKITSPEQLTTALAAVAPAVEVAYVPPTPEVKVQTAAGGLEVSCTGARFVVTQKASGATSEYTYGKTFSTAGPPSEGPPPLDDILATDQGLGTAGGAAGTGTGTGTVGSGTDTGSVGSGTDGAGAPASPTPPAETGSQPPAEVAAGPLDEVEIETMPIAIGTVAAASVLPLGFWMLLGVTGSLARGRTSLRLPPFKDPASG